MDTHQPRADESLNASGNLSLKKGSFPFYFTGSKNEEAFPQPLCLSFVLEIMHTRMDVLLIYFISAFKLG